MFNLQVRIRQLENGADPRPLENGAHSRPRDPRYAEVDERLFSAKTEFVRNLEVLRNAVQLIDSLARF